MSEAPLPNVVKPPSTEEAKVIFETYALAVGKVASAWNILHERLGSLFVTIVGARTPDIALAIWYSPDSDRVKQKMLKDVIESYPSWQWTWFQNHPKAKDDLSWLLDRAMNLGDARNNAIHAPVVLLTDDKGTEIVASFLSPHGRAKNLRGKEILVEFDWIERWADELTRFTQRVNQALQDASAPWPERPDKPNRKPRSTLGLPPRPRTE